MFVYVCVNVGTQILVNKNPTCLSCPMLAECDGIYVGWIDHILKSESEAAFSGPGNKNVGLQIRWSIVKNVVWYIYLAW